MNNVVPFTKKSIEILNPTRRANRMLLPRWRVQRTLWERAMTWLHCMHLHSMNIFCVLPEFGLLGPHLLRSHLGHSNYCSRSHIACWNVVVEGQMTHISGSHVVSSLKYKEGNLLKPCRRPCYVVLCYGFTHR